MVSYIVKITRYHKSSYKTNFPSTWKDALIYKAFEQEKYEIQ